MLPANSHPIEILLISDSAADAPCLNQCLDLAPGEYNITQVEQVDDGLAKLRSRNVDVILLDLKLKTNKRMAQLEALHAAATDLPILILIHSSQADRQELIAEALQAGAQDYLEQDRLTTDALQRSIRYALDALRHKRERECCLQTIRHQEALLRNIFEASRDAMLILNRQYEIQYFNPAAASLLGSEQPGLIGETFPFEISPGHSSELEIPDVNGSSIIVELTASDLLWQGEHALLVILRDISRQRAAEMRMSREREQLTVILESIADAVIATDSSGTIERMNQPACRLTGVSSQQARGRPLGEVLHLKHPESGELVATPDNNLIGNFGAGGLTLIQHNGAAEISVTVEMHDIFDAADNDQGSITLLRQATTKNKSEEENLKQERLNSISLLAGGIAHDFNNMLTAILGNLSIVRMHISAEDENAKKLLAAETAALQARSLTQQLLTFAKGGAPSLEVTTIYQLVEECAQFILRGSNVKCEVKQDERLWQVDADKGQISQVMNNLLINADQAMANGGIISIKLRNCKLRDSDVPALRAGDYVCIEVADQGIGIQPEHIQHVFDPYFTTKKDGNGLGLASSNSIIRTQHGAMTVESEPGRGTRFCVYLPRSEKVPVPLKPRPAAPSQDSETIHTGTGRILVMDDMEAMMLVAGEILNALGYEVEFATNGLEAIERYKQAKEAGNPFDAVVFDLTVPGGMGGEEAGNILLEYDPGLIAIASSGYSTSTIMSDHRNSAFKAVVPKPYRIKEMSDALHRVLQQPGKSA